jgi:hypothetical protein
VSFSILSCLSLRDFKKALCRLGKTYQVPDKSPINITRAIKATEITSKLNLRIRFPYACAQLISPCPAGMRLAAPISLILICEKITPLEQLFPYFFPRVSVASRYGAWRVAAIVETRLEAF